MLVTLSGIAILVREMQSEKALTPILATSSGRVMLVREGQFENAPFFYPVRTLFIVNPYPY